MKGPKIYPPGPVWGGGGGEGGPCLLPGGQRWLWPRHLAMTTLYPKIRILVRDAIYLIATAVVVVFSSWTLFVRIMRGRKSLHN